MNLAVAALGKDSLTHNNLRFFPKASTFFSVGNTSNPAVWSILETINVLLSHPASASINVKSSPMTANVYAPQTAWFAWHSWASSWQIKCYAGETKGRNYIAAWKRWWFHLKCISFCFAKPSNLSGVLLDGLIPNENFLAPEVGHFGNGLRWPEQTEDVGQRVYVIRNIYLGGSVQMFYSQTFIFSSGVSCLCVWDSSLLPAAEKLNQQPCK